jgi:tetraprenyl-beta-curcumene synthase
VVESEFAANATAVVSALITYERQILPYVRGELDRWRARATTIPDPALREKALMALREKGRNVEATAVFGILAPRARRAGPVRAMTALQAAIDFLDSLSEHPVDDPLADGLALHRAVVDAVSPGAEPGDWYRLHPEREDGGYLAALVAACQEELAALPALDAVLPPLRRAARRCGEGQSYTHAAARAGAGELEAWATDQEQAPGYLWWEVAAGGSSSVAAHALIAAAADPASTAEEAALVDAAYFPPIGALTVLLDDLIDRDEDLKAGEHNYLNYCANPQEAANRIGLLAGQAKAATGHLRHARRHRAILAGVAGFYLSAAAPSGYAHQIRERLLESLDPTVRLIMVAMRLRRHG